MTRMCFAAIKAAKEDMALIQQLAESNDPDAMSKILATSSKWNADFKDVDPTWKPDSGRFSKPAPEQAAFIQH